MAAQKRRDTAPKNRRYRSGRFAGNRIILPGKNDGSETTKYAGIVLVKSAEILRPRILRLESENRVAVK